MKVLILGCGWYGCHAASVLLRAGVTFDLWDTARTFFSGSSSKNQNRLHLGFHYCKSHATRRECIDGYKRFIKLYGQFTLKIPQNIYFIDKNSILDFETYKIIFANDFRTPTQISFDFYVEKSKYQGVIAVDERYIDFEACRKHFEEMLGPYLLSDPPPDQNIYDLIIDCTFQKTDETFAEDCISHVYRYKHPIKELFAITIVDGPFFSLFPYKDNLFTLTDVEFTPYKHKDMRAHIEKKAKSYIPDFDSYFEYVESFMSHKIKPINNSNDDRSLIFKKHGKKIIVRGGKIGGIFAMEDMLKNIL